MSDLNPTYGALFVGFLLSAVLFGVTMLQTFVYFQQYASDRAWRKMSVCWLWFLDALHLALSAHFVYHYLVTDYARPDALSQIVWSYKLRIVVDALVVASVHTLYTSRLWTLLAIDDHVEPFGKEARRWSRQKMTVHASATRWVMRRIAPWLASALVVVGYALGIVMCIVTFKLDTFGDLLHAPWATFIPLGSSTVIDVIIAGSLCYFLARCRPRSTAMEGPAKTFMMYTLNTGIITRHVQPLTTPFQVRFSQCFVRSYDGRRSFCSLITISTMVAFPTTFIPIAIEFLVIKRTPSAAAVHIISLALTNAFPLRIVYINSLNARSVLHPAWHDHPDAPDCALPTLLPARARPAHDQKRPLPFPFPFPASSSSLQLAPSPIPTPTQAGASNRSPSHSPSPEWPRASPASTLRAPRMTHPDACPHYGVVETPVGISVDSQGGFAVPPLGSRAHSFASSASSVTATATTTPAAFLLPSPTSSPSLATTKASAMSFAHPLDPLTPLPHPQFPLRRHTVDVDEFGALSNAGHGTARSPGAEHPASPLDRALSPLRFASHAEGSRSPAGSLSTSTAPRSLSLSLPLPLPAPSSPSPSPTPTPSSPSFSIPSPCPSPSYTATAFPRPSRPRLPSAFSDSEEGGLSTLTSPPLVMPSLVQPPVLPSLMYDAAQGGGRRYTRMVNEARESRRGSGFAARDVGGGGGGGGMGVEDERGVWVWGGPGHGPLVS
ncbi:hypothetical protein C8Q78DRAFT_1077534 [Trametes maxima]|nr:hypothetical protein C8Q78DRAFT_1077534 [Trametes maxima]